MNLSLNLFLNKKLDSYIRFLVINYIFYYFNEISFILNKKVESYKANFIKHYIDSFA